MISKKIIGIAASAFLLFNVAVSAGVKTSNLNMASASTGDVAVLPHDNYVHGGPYDLAIANEDKIIEMLKKEGKIAKNATPAQIQKAYANYLNQVAASQAEMGKSVTKLDKTFKAINSQKVNDYLNKQSATKPSTKTSVNSSTGLKEVQEQTWNGAVRKDRIMVLLIDFPDFKHNNIKPEDGPVLYYPDYTHQHYQDMIFGDNGYTGNDGTKYMSVKQFYEAQSGGSYTIEGNVFGWYTASQNAAYYGAHTSTGGNDVKPRDLVKEALAQAANDPALTALGGFSYFDQEDRYDLNDNGNTREADNMVDHLIVIHAGCGEEAGGGALGDDAIWSHRWNLGGMYKIPGTTYYAYDYTTEPEDGAAGVFAHEYGHDLGLPDEYDTQYSGSGEPIGMWSIMSSGSWAGKIGGTEPTGFSPYAKEFFQATIGGNWQPNVETINYSDLTTTGKSVILDQASSHGLNKNVVKVNLPDKTIKYTDVFGTNAYYGGKGTDKTPFDTNMITSVDLTGKTTAELDFKTWYDIENLWDFGSVEVREVGTTDWTAIAGNITTTEHDPDADVVVANGITGSSNDQWVDGIFDLSAYAGKKIELRFHYQCDAYSYGTGWFIDNIVVKADGAALVSDDAEGASSIFTMTGFSKNDGYSKGFKNYYLVEWRNHQGVDAALANINRGGQMLSYDPGMLVWYVDNMFSDNWTGIHPGDGYLGIVDADQTPMIWNYNDGSVAPASNSYQMHDAAFSLRKGLPFLLDQTNTIYERTLSDKDNFMHPFFDDARSYLNPGNPHVGRNVPKVGIKIYVTGETRDRSSASILIKK